MMEHSLLPQYDVFFLDAYGVLVNAEGALPGAAKFLERLRSAGKRCLIVSNDASRSTLTIAQRYGAFGLPLTDTDVITAGMLLPAYFAREKLIGARCIVLGTNDSRRFVEEAGGVVTDPRDDEASVCVLADDDGYEFLKTINDVLSVLFRRLERGQQTHLLLPNPDLVYPREAGGVGAAAGSVAALIETALTLRDPSRSHCFVPLGKPHAPLFEAAMEKLGLVDKRRVVMVGDQLSTDIRGAAAFAIDSILVLSGIGRRQDLETSDVQPTHVITSVDVLLYFVTYFKKWFQLDRRRALN